MTTRTLNRKQQSFLTPEIKHALFVLFILAVIVLGLFSIAFMNPSPMPVNGGFN